MRSRLLLVLVLLGTSVAQDHPRFWTKKKVLLFTGLAAAMAYDGYTTQRTLNGPYHGWEKNPLARPFVNLGWGGQAGCSGVVFAGTVWTSYLLHKHGHPRLAWVLPLSLTGTSTLLGKVNGVNY